MIVSKADMYHAVPPPITGNFLTPRADISFAGLDEYAIRKKIIESKTTDLNTKTSETVGKTNEANTQKPKTVYESVNKDKVIIEDWNSDDEDDVSEVQTSQEPKLKNMVNTGPRVNKPVWDNAKRQNEKRAVHGTASTARPVGTARPFTPKIAQTGSAIRPIYPRMDNVRPRASYSPIKRSYYTRPAVRPKDLKQDVKTFGVKNMTTAETRAVVNTGKSKMDNALKKSRWVWKPKGNCMDHGNLEICLQDHAVVDSGCSSHMTGNKAYLSDYEDYNGGFVAFGSDPKGGKITSLSFLIKVKLYLELLDRMQTKSTYGKAVLTLVERVKLLEDTLKRKSMKVILSESEDEETEDQGRKIQDIDNDPLVSLVRNSMEEKEADFVTPKKVSALGEAQEEDISPTTLEAAKTLSKVASQNVSTYKRRARSASKGKDIGIGMDFFSATKERLNSAEVEVNTEVNPGSAGVNTGNTLVSTPSVIQTMNVIVLSPVKIQRERKAPMTSEDVQATQKTKEQIRQEETDLAEAMRLQDLQDEEDARQKRKAEVQEAAQFYTEEDWDTIRTPLRAKLEGKMQEI
ncbi:hypothetical protein Tco_0202093 [Tanacetum coccineum]